MSKSASISARARKLQRLVGELARSVRSQYDALRDDALRRSPEIRTDRSETLQDFYGYRRLKAYEQADRIYDNASVGGVVDTVVRMAVGATGGRPYFLGDGADAAQERFGAWKSACGWAEGEDWNSMLQLILRAVIVHGDCLVLCDRDLTGGLLRVFDADQICPVSPADFDRWGREHGLPTTGDEGAAKWTQAEGAVVDPEGRVSGYFVTNLRSRYAVSLDHATYLPAGVCRRVGERKKISQYRGEPAILPQQELIEDTNSLMKSEVAAAKNFSETSMLFIRPQPAVAQEMRDLLTPDGTQIDPDVAAAAGVSQNDAAGLVKALDEQPAAIPALEGKAAYAWLPQGTGVQFPPAGSHPASTMQQWLDKLADICGQRLGVWSCLSRGRADNSYSSGQIEVSISWQKFAEHQKMLERLVVDYVLPQVCPGARYVVRWPKAFEIDPEKTERVLDAQLKGGRASYQEIVGPDWRGKLDDLAEVAAYCKSKGIDPAQVSWMGETGAGNQRVPSAAPSAPATTEESSHV